MNFNKIFILFLIVFIFNCKNPYLVDPKFNTKIILFDHLPVNKNDVQWMQPYGFVVYDAMRSANHKGFDFGMKYNYASFYSCGNGVVAEVDYNTGEGLPGTNYRIVIQTSSRVFLDYHFEIYGSVSEDERKRNIFVKPGDYVKGGQKIANLISLKDGAHVHFGIKLDDKMDKCPLYFFTNEAAQRLEDIFDSVEKRPYKDNLCE